MNYKTIAVHVNESCHCVGRIQLAAKVANKFNAHLVGVATTSVPPALYMSPLGDGMASYCPPTRIT